MWPDLWKGVLYMHSFVWLWSGITSFVSELLSWNFLSYKCNDRKVLLSNFKAVGQTHVNVELHSFKVEKLDVCIRPFSHKFGHIIIIVYICVYVCNWFIVRDSDQYSRGILSAKAHFEGI